MKTRTLKAWLGAAVCSVAAWAGVAPAHAAIVTGSWDPPFSGALSGLGWTATVNLYVPDGCFVSAPAGFATNILGRTVGCAGGLAPAMTVLSAEVGIYDLATGSPDNLLDVLTFSPASLPLLAVGIDDVHDVLTFYRSVGTSNTVRGHAAGITDGFDFRIRLNDPANRPFGETAAPWVEFAAAGSRNFTRSSNPPDQVSYSVGSDSQRDAILQETRLLVPEPTSVSLVLLALGAAGAAARRRATAGAAQG